MGAIDIDSTLDTGNNNSNNTVKPFIKPSKVGVGRKEFNHNNTVIVDSKIKDDNIVSDPGSVSPTALVCPVLDHVRTLDLETRLRYAKNSTIDSAETCAWYAKNSLIDTIIIDVDVAVVFDSDSDLVSATSTSSNDNNIIHNNNMDLEKESPPNKDFILLSTYVSTTTINNRSTINNDNKITSTTFKSISYCTSNNINIKDFGSRAKVEVDFINEPGPISDSCTFNFFSPIHKFTTNNESTRTTNSRGKCKCGYETGEKYDSSREEEWFSSDDSYTTSDDDSER